MIVLDKQPIPEESPYPQPANVYHINGKRTKVNSYQIDAKFRTSYNILD